MLARFLAESALYNIAGGWTFSHLQ
jgi:hypothetical protein